MKKVLVVLAMICSTVAMANGLSARSSWSEILRTPDVKADFQQVQFNSGFFIAAIDTCVDGDNLTTTKPVEVCVAYKSGKDGDVCVETAERILTTPRAYTKEICSKWSGNGENCEEYTSYPAVYPTSYSVPVYKLTGRDDGNQVLLFNKNLKLEACK